MWIDLTKTVTNELKGYGDDPLTNITQLKDVHNDGYSLYQLSMGMHTGTHIDGPRHMLEEGPMIDEIPLEQLIGQAKIIDASDDNLVTDQHKDAKKIVKKDIVFVYGGHTPTIIDESFARLLIRKHIKVLGIDFASPDEAPYKIHKLLFAKEILILEHLCQLDKLLEEEHIEIVIAPLKMHTDGAVARVYAKI